MTLDDTRARRLIIAAAAAGLALRLAFGFLYWVDKPLTHDEHEYLALARGVASGLGFVYDDAHDSGTAQRFGRAPGYPLFLAALDAGRPVPTATPARVKVAQSLVGALTVWLIGLIALYCRRPAGRRVGGRDRARCIRRSSRCPSYALSETLYSAVALASGVRASARGRSRAPGRGAHVQARSVLARARGRARRAAPRSSGPRCCSSCRWRSAWLAARRRLALAVALRWRQSP